MDWGGRSWLGHCQGESRLRECGREAPGSGPESAVGDEDRGCMWRAGCTAAAEVQDGTKGLAARLGSGTILCGAKNKGIQVCKAA